MKYFFLFLIIFFSEIYVNAQPWLQNIKQKRSELNYYQQKDAFEKYWKDKKIEKGKGWKQFQRWNYFMEPRAYPSGKIPKSAIYNVKKRKRSQKNYGNWQPLGPDYSPPWLKSKLSYGIGRINCIEFQADNKNIIWVGTPSGGIWKTEDKGTSWHSTTDNFPALGISDIVINPLYPDSMYIATGDADGEDTYSFGLMISSDAGKTWQPTELSYKISEKVSTTKILINPQSPHKLIVASTEGIYVSEDAARSWTKTIDGNFTDIEFNPDNPNIIYAADCSGSSATVLKSADGGKIFMQTNAFPENNRMNRIEIAVTKANADRVYAIGSNGLDNGIGYFNVSYNSGESWKYKEAHKPEKNLLGWSADGSDKGGQGWYDLTLLASPQNPDLIYLGGINIWKSKNAGEDWELLTNWKSPKKQEYIHADQHELCFSPFDKMLYSANDGGLYRKNENDEWEFISDSMEILQVYNIGVNSLRPDMIIAGSQDNGTMLKHNGKWSKILSGDGMCCFIDPISPRIMYAEYNNGGLMKSTKSGADFKDISPPAEKGNGAWVTPFIIDPKDRHTLIAGYNDIYMSNSAGDKWKKITNNLSPYHKIQHLAISASTERVIYAASFYSIWKINLYPQIKVEKIGTTLPKLAVSSINVSPNSENKIWVTLSGYEEENKIFVSEDSGKSWHNMSVGLPNVPVNCMLLDNTGNELQLYAGTDVGVFFYDNEAQQWSDFSRNLPNVIVNDLKINGFKKKNKIIAATFGRGLWETYSSPYADFSVSTTETSKNKAVTFTNLSFISPTKYEWDFGEGAEPRFVNGEGPHTVKYKTTGIKDVKLTVEEGGRQNTMLKEKCITVLPDLFNIISPNPSKGNFKLKLVSEEMGYLKLKIIDSKGALINTFKLNKNMEMQEFNIETGIHSSGIFFLKIKGCGFNTTTKIVVNKNKL